MPITALRKQEFLRDQLACRQDIAGYLHDTVSQSMVAVSLLLARLGSDPAVASAPGFTRVVELCEVCSREVRVLSDALSQPVASRANLDDGDDPINALRWYVQTLREDSGLNVRFEFFGEEQPAGGRADGYGDGMAAGKHPVAIGDFVRMLICVALQRWAEAAIYQMSSSGSGSAGLKSARAKSPATCIRLARTSRGLELHFMSDRSGDPAIAAVLSSSLIRESLGATYGILQSTPFMTGDSARLVFGAETLVPLSEPTSRLAARVA